MIALRVDTTGRRVEVGPEEGGRWFSLSLLAALDTIAAPDETLAIEAPREEGGVTIVERRSTVWDRAWTELRLRDGALEIQSCVSGHGALAEVRLLGGRSAIAGAPLGLLVSGTDLRTLFNPSPEDDLAPERPVREGAANGVLGDGEPGRGRWLFTPAPLYLAFGDGGTWVDLGVAAPVAELRFLELVCESHANGFSIRLDYEGHTRVDGEFRAPALVLTPDVSDPYTGLRRHRDDLAARGHAPPPARRERQGWWLEPIFCGWGAQCYLETVSGGLARDYATQENYDAFLAALAAHDAEPGTIVLDDKWQATYGANEPDPVKWPDLAGWIADRHADGRHVLLWWKAWDPDGVDPALCVRNADGTPVALDPSNPATREFLHAMLARMLAGDGLDADGLKIDFTARTPSGRALTHSGGAWGIALLHELLAVVYEAAKAAKPDALVITHTPHPSFADVTDMIRLNDMFGGAIVPQMTFRAEVVRAALPELPIDTDDWRIPDKRQWREFLEVKPEIGVPSLYYATHLDATGEALDDDDYRALRHAWAKCSVRRLDEAHQGAQASALPMPERERQA
jgi:hypothetical protein